MNQFTFTPATIALIEADASERYGIQLRFVGDVALEPETKHASLKQMAPKQALSTKPTPKKPANGKIKAPPRPEELEAMILTSLGAHGSVQAADFYNRWPADQRKKAKVRVKAVLDKLVQAGKLIKEGHAQHTRYKLKKT